MNIKKRLATLVAFIALITIGAYYLATVDLLKGERYLKNATRAFEDVTIRENKYGVKYIDA